MKKLLIAIFICLTLSGCAFVACGDRGVDSKYGFLWLKYKCTGDRWCDKCHSWVEKGWDCEEACK